MKAERLRGRHHILTAYFLQAYSTRSERVFSSKLFDHPFIILIERGCSGPYFSQSWSFPGRELEFEMLPGSYCEVHGRCLYCIACWRIQEKHREFSGFSGVALRVRKRATL